MHNIFCLIYLLFFWSNTQCCELKTQCKGSTGKKFPFLGGNFLPRGVGGIPNHKTFVIRNTLWMVRREVQMSIFCLSLKYIGGHLEIYFWGLEICLRKFGNIFQGIRNIFEVGWGKKRGPDVNLLSEFDQLCSPLSPTFTFTYIIITTNELI